MVSERNPHHGGIEVLNLLIQFGRLDVWVGQPHHHNAPRQVGTILDHNAPRKQYWITMHLDR